MDFIFPHTTEKKAAQFELDRLARLCINLEVSYKDQPVLNETFRVLEGEPASVEQSGYLVSLENQVTNNGLLKINLSIQTDDHTDYPAGFVASHELNLEPNIGITSLVEANSDLKVSLLAYPEKKHFSAS